MKFADLPANSLFINIDPRDVAYRDTLYYKIKEVNDINCIQLDGCVKTGFTDDTEVQKIDQNQLLGKKYEDWTNYATWLAYEFLENDYNCTELFYEIMDEIQDGSVENIAQKLKEIVDEEVETEARGFVLDAANATFEDANYFEIAKYLIDNNKYRRLVSNIKKGEEFTVDGVHYIKSKDSELAWNISGRCTKVFYEWKLVRED